MTVAATTNRKSYAGDDATTSFATTPVVFFATSDLRVSVVTDSTGAETVLTENTGYTVSGGDGAVGTVNLAAGTSPHGALLSGTTLVILRQLPLTQASDLVNNSASDAEVIEDGFDRLVMISQQLEEGSDRTVRLPEAEVGTAVKTELPFDRASKYLAFNASKELIAADPPEGGNVVSAFMATVLDDVAAADARTTLGASATTPPDDVFRIVGSADSTKKLAIEVDGFTTATTRTLTPPDADLTLPAVTAKGDVVAATGSGVLARVAVSATDGDVLIADSAASAGVSYRPKLVLRPAVAHSFHAWDFLDIPSWAKRLTLIWNEVSFSGTDHGRLFLGDAGGLEASGYISSSGHIINGASSGVLSDTAGFAVRVGNAAHMLSGHMVLTHMGSNLWIASHNGKVSATITVAGGGSKTLSDTLTRIRLAKTGTDTVDNGTVGLMYE